MRLNRRRQLRIGALPCFAFLLSGNAWVSVCDRLPTTHFTTISPSLQPYHYHCNHVTIIATASPSLQLHHHYCNCINIATASPISRCRDERSRLQSKTLEALFEALFRVIKHAAGSAALTALHAGPLQPAACASKFPLLPAALQGLQQYAHLIDVDYFESLLTVLTTLVNAPRLPVTEKLCVLLAASQLLRYVHMPGMDAWGQFALQRCSPTLYVHYGQIVT